MLYWQLFITFLKIGTFTIGGGYAMIPLIEREVVSRRGWIGEQEFLNMLALAQAAPGLIAVNTAVFVGYAIKGWRGVICTVIGAVLPSFVIILLIATVFTRFREYPAVEAVMKGVRPAVVALIVAPLFRMAKTAGMVPLKETPTQNSNQTKSTKLVEWWRLLLLLIPISAALLIWLCDISPVLIIIITIVSALAICFARQQKSKCH
ncbi:MAG: chromate transporter [Paludibacteraceae bacterium]|nr:chromate transporter [Paludibacteraceae bacterium]